MRWAGVIIGFVLAALSLFVLSSLIYDHLGPRFHVNAVPPEGMDDSRFAGYVDFHCPAVSYSFDYHFPTTVSLAKIQLMVEGRALPIDLCRTSPSAPGDAPLCPAVECSGYTCFRGRAQASKVRLPICQQIRDSSPQVRVVASTTNGPLAIGSLVRHATE
jgi:hypothetical protein